MTEKRGTTTEADRQAAALGRLDQGPATSAVDYFRVTGGAAKTRVNTHSLPQVRVPEDLARDLAAYGNANALSYSETVRTVLRLGLQKAEEDHDGNAAD